MIFFPGNNNVVYTTKSVNLCLCLSVCLSVSLSFNSFSIYFSFKLILSSFIYVL